jgi:hypothetical protein
MKKVLLALIAAASLAGPAAAASWPYSRFIPDVQSGGGGGGGGRGQGGSGQERRDGRRDAPPQQDRRAEREERRDRMSDDDRRALHRDLDKANRELYRRRER